MRVDAGVARAVATTDTLGLFYLHDGQDILLAFDDEGDLTNRYLHGPAVDQILADEQVDDLESPGDFLWPLADNLGSVRDRDIVDSDGDVSPKKDSVFTLMVFQGHKARFDS